MLTQLVPGCVPLPDEAARRLALCCEGRKTPQTVLPAAACLFLLLGIHWAALKQPDQLLQDGGALDGECLASADPVLQSFLWRQTAARILDVSLQVGFDTLDVICLPPGSWDGKGKGQFSPPSNGI